MDQLTVPKEGTIKTLKTVIRMLDNPNCLAIIKYLIEHGAANIRDIADDPDVTIPYRTLQTNQYYLMNNGLIEYREQTDSKERQCIWFTPIAELSVRSIQGFEQTINQFLLNKKLPNNGTRFR